VVWVVGVSEAEPVAERLGCHVVVWVPTFFVMVQLLTSVRTQLSVTEGEVGETRVFVVLRDENGWSTQQVEAS